MKQYSLNPIKQLDKAELTEVVRQQLETSRCAEVHIWDGMISEQQLQEILVTIDRRGYVRDALHILGNPESDRQSIAYLVRYPGSKEDIKFEVVNTQMQGPSPHGYLGHIFNYDAAGNEVRQLTLKMLSDSSPRK